MDTCTIYIILVQLYKISLLYNCTINHSNKTLQDITSVHLYNIYNSIITVQDFALVQLYKISLLYNCTIYHSCTTVQEISLVPVYKISLLHNCTIYDSQTCPPAASPCSSRSPSQEQLEPLDVDETVSYYLLNTVLLTSESSSSFTCLTRQVNKTSKTIIEITAFTPPCFTKPLTSFSSLRASKCYLPLVYPFHPVSPSYKLEIPSRWQVS